MEISNENASIVTSHPSGASTADREIRSQCLANQQQNSIETYRISIVKQVPARIGFINKISKANHLRRELLSIPLFMTK